MDRRYRLFREKSFDIAPPISVKPGYGGIHHTMLKLKVALTVFVVPVILLFASRNLASPNSATKKNQNGYGQTGTLQKMIVENGSVAMQVDLNALNGNNSLVARPVMLRFTAAANSFFPVLVFNDLLRGLQPGSMVLIPAGDNSVAGIGDAGVTAPGYSNLPAALREAIKRLTFVKLPSGQGFELAVRDSNTGFTFFNIEGHQYDYNAAAQSLTITGGRLLLSKQFANALGVPSEAGSWAGTISIGAAMRPIQIDHIVRGETKSMVMPPMQHAVRSGSAKPCAWPGCYCRRFGIRGASWE